MYAIAIDGELVASVLNSKQVLENLKVREDGKIEVASFDPSLRLWVPVCLDRFGLARAA